MHLWLLDIQIRLFIDAFLKKSDIVAATTGLGCERLLAETAPRVLIRGWLCAFWFYNEVYINNINYCTMMISIISVFFSFSYAACNMIYLFFCAHEYRSERVSGAGWARLILCSRNNYSQVKRTNHFGQNEIVTLGSLNRVVQQQQKKNESFANSISL